MNVVFGTALVLALVGPVVMQLGGGISDTQLDLDDANVQFAVKAINTYHNLLGDTENRTLVDIVSAKSQVVAGTLYHLELKVKTSSQVELCKVEVWSRPWLSGDAALQVTKEPACKMMDMSTTMAPRITGGSVLVDSNDQDVQNALMFAAKYINNMENYMYLRIPVKIEEVKSQVVSGMMYHFRGVEMAATTCRKNDPSVDLTTCPLLVPRDVRGRLFSINMFYYAKYYFSF
ncbi:cystatin [Elysia marginata]|uniref:Cystatin n=1 Tax=Elysia marginata TaxID=1093978 RepID=A0AAV4GLT8_9GAST|nr:cystatin [Elysia marginata]